MDQNNIWEIIQQTRFRRHFQHVATRLIRLMPKTQSIRKSVSSIINAIPVDGILRRLNREKILILAYHGISSRTFNIPSDTHIPLKSFEKQVSYISRRYRVLRLRDVIAAILSNEKLPPNSAVITFDDGYKNNLSLALPVLEKHQAPATLFLTSGYIDSADLLPLDLVFISFCCASLLEMTPIVHTLDPLDLSTSDNRYSSYQKTVKYLKRISGPVQKEIIRDLFSDLMPNKHKDYDAVVQEFALLSWADVNAMLRSGLVDLGAHTANHSILTNLPIDKACVEIEDSIKTIREYTGAEIQTFAYPNGKENDFNTLHIETLKKAGLVGAVTTNPTLNSPKPDLFRLSRFCIGNDLSSSLSKFRNKTAGLNSMFRLEKHS